jgi:hypothetical protein
MSAMFQWSAARINITLRRGSPPQPEQLHTAIRRRMNAFD